MDFNFDISTTSTYKSLRLWSFPLFLHAKILGQIFLGLFMLSLALLAFSFLGVTSTATAEKISIFLLVVDIALWEIYLFTELKIKKPVITGLLADALANPENHNLAEFLSLEVCQIVESAIKKNKQKKLLGISSESLLYFGARQNKDIQTVLFRLGLDAKKLVGELKNYLEKQRRSNQLTVSLSTSFQKTMVEAGELAVERGKNVITEKDLLAALAIHDAFFKKVLVEHELKKEDVKNITWWLDEFEQKLQKSRQFWNRQNLARLGSLGKDFAAGFTITLDKFSIDWGRRARKNIFNEVIGHAKEIDAVELVLAKSAQSNALIIGDPGIGRKSIVEALAQRCFLGSGLAELKNKRVVELNMVFLLTQIQNPEMVETTLNDIFEEVLAAGNIILVIDQLDNFAEQKVARPGAIDISVILSKYLALPNFHFIGITSYDGLHRRLEQNPGLVEQFRKVEVLEISEPETIMILQNLALAFEQKYKILITYPAIREIVNLTGRYFANTPFPKKAIDVLEEAAVHAGTTREFSLGGNSRIVMPADIAKIISDKTQIPIGKMEFKEKSVLLNLENLIHERIIGQTEAVNEISIAMRRARSGLASKKRPMGVFLFLGPTGVGKTETAKALAQIYFGNEEKMIRLDMSEFQSVSDIPRLLGKTGQEEEQGLLTTPVRENPFSLVLLDEIEKAHPNILNLFLQVFDEGHITDGQGRKVMFTNTIIICTSNAGADMVFAEVEAGQSIEKDKILDALFQKGIFKPEFINRFDATVFFHALTKENLLDIATLNLQGLAKNLKEKEIDLMVTTALKEKIVELSYKPEFGAREMRRVIQDKLENGIAEALLSDKIVKGDSIEINPDNFEIIKIQNNG